MISAGSKLLFFWFRNWRIRPVIYEWVDNNPNFDDYKECSELWLLPILIFSTMVEDFPPPRPLCETIGMCWWLHSSCEFWSGVGSRQTLSLSLSVSSFSIQQPTLPVVPMILKPLIIPYKTGWIGRDVVIRERVQCLGSYLRRLCHIVFWTQWRPLFPVYWWIDEHIFVSCLRKLPTILTFVRGYST
jgi:hypothetical protein